MGKVIVGDIWAQYGIKIISTNLGGVHGRGLAKQAKDKGLITSQNRDFSSSPRFDVITIAVKGWAPETRRIPGQAFSEQVSGKNIDLLRSELDKLIALARKFPDTPYLLPFIGLGFGEGDPETILPMLYKAAEEPNISLVSKDEDTVARYPASFAPGVRQDRVSPAMKVIAATGHRPNKLGGYSQDVFNKLVRCAVAGLQSSLPTKVISGMALGWDMAVATAAIQLHIPFVAAVPFQGQEGKWLPASVQLYESLIGNAAEVVYVCPPGYAAWKMQRRNEWMVDRCTTILALWDGSSGGTGNCIKYANKKSKQIINMWEVFSK